jgi:hypothetical protein
MLESGSTWIYSAVDQLLQDGFIVPVALCPHFFEAAACAMPSDVSDAVCVGCTAGGFRCRSTSGSLAITRPKCDSICDAVGRCWLVYRVYHQRTKALESFSIDGVEYIRSSELLGSTYRKQTKQTQAFAYLLIICSSLILIKETLISQCSPAIRWPCSPRAWHTHSISWRRVEFMLADGRISNYGIDDHNIHNACHVWIMPHIMETHIMYNIYDREYGYTNVHQSFYYPYI